MHLFIPTVLWAINPMGHTDLDTMLSGRGPVFLCLKDQLREESYYNFFREEVCGRFNNVAHTKVVSRDRKRLFVPTLSAGSSPTYRFPSCTVFNDTSATYGMRIRGFCKNYGNFCYRARILESINGAGRLLYSFTVNLYVAVSVYNNILTYGHYSFYANYELSHYSEKGKRTDYEGYTTSTSSDSPYVHDWALIAPILMNIVDQPYNSKVNLNNTKNRESWNSACNSVFGPVSSLIEKIALDTENFTTIPTWLSGRSSSKTRFTTFTGANVPATSFLLHEDEYAFKDADFSFHGRSFDSYWIELLKQNSYLDACNRMPRLNDNSISNIMEIAAFIKALLIDHKIEIPKSLSNAWLAYRYQYMTTKLDAEEAIKFVHRHMDLGTLDTDIRCFGSYETEYNGIDIQCSCGVTFSPKEVGTLGRIWRSLYTYGLQPSFYVVWDSIPYSFIIDWLLPIGRLAAVADASRNYSGTYYDIKDIIFSISYVTHDDGYYIRHYTRWCDSSPPELNGFYFLEEEPVSTRVLGMRALDTLSLFIL